MKFAVVLQKVSRRTVFVEADDADHARSVVYSSLSLSSRPGDDESAIAADAAPDDSRLSTYECRWCRFQSFKEQWGPGRIKCPCCGKLAPSAEEAAALDKEGGTP